MPAAARRLHRVAPAPGFPSVPGGSTCRVPRLKRCAWRTRIPAPSSSPAGGSRRSSDLSAPAARQLRTAAETLCDNRGSRWWRTRRARCASYGDPADTPAQGPAGADQFLPWRSPATRPDAAARYLRPGLQRVGYDGFIGRPGACARPRKDKPLGHHAHHYIAPSVEHDLAPDVFRISAELLLPG